VREALKNSPSGYHLAQTDPESAMESEDDMQTRKLASINLPSEDVNGLSEDVSQNKRQDIIRRLGIKKKTSTDSSSRKNLSDKELRRRFSKGSLKKSTFQDSGSTDTVDSTDSEGYN